MVHLPAQQHPDQKKKRKKKKERIVIGNGADNIT
jgi:hypothetical protein